MGSVLEGMEDGSVGLLGTLRSVCEGTVGDSRTTVALKTIVGNGCGSYSPVLIDMSDSWNGTPMELGEDVVSSFKVSAVPPRHLSSLLIKQVAAQARTLGIELETLHAVGPVAGRAASWRTELRDKAYRAYQMSQGDCKGCAFSELAVGHQDAALGRAHSSLALERLPEGPAADSENEMEVDGLNLATERPEGCSCLMGTFLLRKFRAALWLLSGPGVHVSAQQTVQLSVLRSPTQSRHLFGVVPRFSDCPMTLSLVRSGQRFPRCALTTCREHTTTCGTWHAPGWQPWLG